MQTNATPATFTTCKQNYMIAPFLHTFFDLLGLATISSSGCVSFLFGFFFIYFYLFALQHKC